MNLSDKFDVHVRVSFVLDTTLCTDPTLVTIQMDILLILKHFFSDLRNKKAKRFWPEKKKHMKCIKINGSFSFFFFQYNVVKQLFLSDA